MNTTNIECYAVPGGSVIDEINPETGLTYCYSRTLEDCQAEYPGAVKMTLADWCATKAAAQDTPIEWTETTEERCDEMLNVLPPRAMSKGGFLVGEPWDHHATTGRGRYQAFRAWHGQFFAANRPMTVTEFNEQMNQSPVPSTR